MIRRLLIAAAVVALAAIGAGAMRDVGEGAEREAAAMRGLADE